MREIRLSGSEGGAGHLNAPSLPLSPSHGASAWTTARSGKWGSEAQRLVVAGARRPGREDESSSRGARCGGLAGRVLRSQSLGMSSLLSRITVEPGKCGGRPCIRGFRIRVKDVLELLAHGAAWEEILQDYPFLEADDIRACLQYAAAQNDHVVLRAS